MNDILLYLEQLVSFDSSHPLLFTQIHFWVFFSIVFLIYTLIGTRRPLTKGRRVLRNGYLFLVSLLFYYKTSGTFVLLLLLSTLLGWIIGILMDRTRNEGWRKSLMITGVVLNIFMLFYYKYAYFFVDIYNATFGTNVIVVNHFAEWGNSLLSSNHFDASVILLPVGISFFTFQNISYIVDVYKKKISHVGNILDFGFYTSFFPQLVAGPILRADQFVPQLYKPFFLSRRQFGIAMFWILNGLFKKLLMSDFLALNFVDRIFENPALYTPFENFSALMLYSLQVYADFSGYTDIAIGVAMLMGFYLPVNFNSPYKATNPADFWHRWHMSLSRWLRDYLYIPLGGNRRAGWVSYTILAVILAIAAFRLQNIGFTIAVVTVLLIVLLMYLLRPKKRRTLGTNVNNMDTMLLGGLWHGASFNFITWGGLNGLGILIYKWWKKQGWITHILTLALLAGIMSILKATMESPLINLLWFTALVCFAIYTLLHLLPQTSKATQKGWLVWTTLLTFVFISFTRLFFRSGSNLDPAEANEVAWMTASLMVQQIGSAWNFAQIPEIIASYWAPFALFVVGMIIHWLPTNFKRRYRLWFACMPLWIMVPLIIVSVIVLYQFVSADLQPFIYFQF